LQVSVPVLSEKTYSTWPNYSHRFDDYGRIGISYSLSYISIS